MRKKNSKYIQSRLPKHTRKFVSNSDQPFPQEILDEQKDKLTHCLPKSSTANNSKLDVKKNDQRK